MSSPENPESSSLISNKYQILGLAGRGGTGVVYKVRHLALDTLFALKALPTEWCDNTEIVNRFHQEARVMARFNHPNIVRVSDVDRDGNTPYFVMEYIEGQALSEYLADNGPLSVREALGIARQITLALDYAHSHPSPVVHRDIKPQNILIETNSKRAVVTDFGIAKVRGASTQTSAELMLGTLLYCAPEQILPNLEIDGRADLYSLGLVLYEMVTRRAFFADLDERTLLGRMLSGPEDNIPVFSLPVPHEFAAVVRRAISRKPEDRYQSAKDLLKDIDACLALLTSSLDAQTLAHPIAMDAIVPIHLQRDILIPSEELSRSLLQQPLVERRRSRVLTSGLLVVGVVSLLWSLTSGQTDPVSPPVQGEPEVVATLPHPGPAPLPQETTLEHQSQALSLALAANLVVAEGTKTLTPDVEMPLPLPSSTSSNVLAMTRESQSEKDKLLAVSAVAQPFPVPRRFQVTTRTAVRESPTWASKETMWLQPGVRVYAVARVGDWLKVESRAHPPKPPGFVWTADARRE